MCQRSLRMTPCFIAVSQYIQSEVLWIHSCQILFTEFTHYTCGKRDTPICLCMMWNRGILSQKKNMIRVKLEPWASTPNRYESDLSNEVLYILVGQMAEKISEVKLKKICQISRAPGASGSRWAALAISNRPPTLTSDIFAASSPTRADSTSFKRSYHYLFRDWKPGP